MAAQFAAIDAWVGEIADTAARHTAGLGEIDAAMRGLDRLTQENAAMVEHSNAASVRLAGEVETLRRRVAEFKLDGALARAA